MAPRPPLTRRQAVILDAITDSVRTRGYPPTVRELCGVSGLTSTSSVAHQLRQLEQRGYIERPTHGGARMITVLSGSSDD